MKKVAFHTLGCKLNFSETSAIGRLFTEKGFVSVTLAQRPHVFVLNTCSVTEHADHKCARIVREALKMAPEAFVIVIGCYAQLKPEAIAAIPGVDAVFGTHEKFKLLDWITDWNKKKSDEPATIQVASIKEKLTFSPAYSIGDRTRTFLKVQDGCSYACSFCTIPLARGPSRSATVAEVVTQAKEIVTKNVKEIVLTGVNLGDFGIIDAKRQTNFFELIQALDEVDGIERFRISSIEPNLLRNEIIDFVASSKRFVPHFHIPLQSGSDKILKAMRRRYLTALYQERIAHIKAQMPTCCIGVDVLVGFPGETEADFLESYHFLNRLPIAYIHVFPYSERPNTKAANMAGVVPQQERVKRARMLRILSEKKLRDFYTQHLGHTATVLFEYGADDDIMEGFTENYIRVQIPYQETLASKLCKVRLKEVNAAGMVVPTLCTST
ncbi:MAG: tRNA (N(6)-L-threonylcarbamoyladenosine(37)-C(2))-methylthiotransferase MtaB [Candidatus Cardinium sp.]|uniref:tRNA (N(6)-L-threonylcarbamoyladenosine(37)-C(2))- methylthiotransferase MtaB n=1 Tax=Cardinium endosymbiont of Dermatophagoides farinae TaxID=2597823 RepID=UPI001181FCD7|nr:tRNA (N(6)-L-threonylcarbamoyladenosine(37)-C(2))-methylthiotransferase MtaB [Cardinium endosymbiont of Dermatophagoides farinae]TSJ80897.1 tRNA (N(6)-L-threonylcarbamoyladenosine(37)-C(2))-methylthiotransferase MtaB [Cardinium endosymbiont of Dermatophagoides farinae]UWW96909.1 MAG: tRNA (N(6)-L-threonylcarbamoyladenosine(37)-C(2))-methylthiotransferase MtaB [Candidatus Cardinium sp.]